MFYSINFVFTRERAFAIKRKLRCTTPPYGDNDSEKEEEIISVTVSTSLKI